MGTRFLLILLLAVAVHGQNQAETSASESQTKRKAKKVYTEDDLKRSFKEDIFGPAAPEIETTGQEKATQSPAPAAQKMPSPLVGCEKPSLTWAGTVMIAARDAGLFLGVDYWHQKLMGTGYCTDRIPPPETIASLANGEHLFADLHRERLKTVYTKGIATAEKFVLAWQDQRPVMVVWSGKPYLVKGITYADRAYQASPDDYTIHRVFTVDTLTLVNPVSGQQRIFTRGENKEEEVDATIEFFALKEERP